MNSAFPQRFLTLISYMHIRYSLSPYDTVLSLTSRYVKNILSN